VPTSSPKPAGLKIWRFESLIKFFENIAIMLITIGTYQERSGDVKSPMMLPVTSEPLGKNGLTPRSLTNKRSEIAVDIRDSRKTRRIFCEGLFRNAVIKMSVRKTPIWVFEVLSKLIKYCIML